MAEQILEHHRQSRCTHVGIQSQLPLNPLILISVLILIVNGNVKMQASSWNETLFSSEPTLLASICPFPVFFSLSQTKLIKYQIDTKRDGNLYWTNTSLLYNPLFSVQQATVHLFSNAERIILHLIWEINEMIEKKRYAWIWPSDLITICNSFILYNTSNHQNTERKE